MRFHIAGPHDHQAVVAGNTYSCVRTDTRTETGVVITWTVRKNGIVIKSDHRTLNDAKKHCREDAARATPAV